MASLINFSGLASGIDSSALIKATLDSERRTRITPLQDKVTSLNEVNTSLEELSGLLSKLKDVGGKFRALNGGALSKIGTSSDETIVSATASNAANNGTYSISVSQLARTGTVSLNDRYTSASDKINASINNGATAASRTVSVTIGTGTNQSSVNIELTDTSTADDFVSQFNTATTAAQASLVNVGTTAAPSYAIVINSTNQGSEKGELAVSVGSEITSAGSGAFTASTLNQAQDAQFTASGISGTITRATNSISDVITGVTLKLQSSGAATISIGDDAAATTQTVQDFVDAYNEVINYIGEHDAVTRNEDGKEATNVFGPLARTSLDENALAALRKSLSSGTVSTGTIHTLADLGITTERDGTLKFNTDTFATALASDPTNTRTITENLGETLSSVNGVISQYTQFNGLIDSEKNANSTQITALNSRVAAIEKLLSQQESSLTSRYASLESLIGKLNSQQNSLAGLTGA